MRFNFGKALDYIFKTAAVVNDTVTSLRYNHVPVPEKLDKLNAGLQKATAISAIGPAVAKVNAFYDEARDKDLDVKLVALDEDGNIVIQLDQTDEERDAVDQLYDVAFG